MDASMDISAAILARPKSWTTCALVGSVNNNVIMRSGLSLLLGFVKPCPRSFQRSHRDSFIACILLGFSSNSGSWTFSFGLGSLKLARG